jgi:uncharacterized membrane protein SirB2
MKILFACFATIAFSPSLLQSSEAEFELTFPFHGHSEPTMIDLLYRYSFCALETIYLSVVETYGILPGVVSILLCIYTPVYLRWILSLLMLLTTMFGVWAAAHYFAYYVFGCAIYIVSTIIGLRVRSKRNSVGINNLYPYDLAIFTIGLIILSIIYKEPLM